MEEGSKMGFDAEDVFVLHPERVGQTELIVTQRLPRAMGPDGAQEALVACGMVLNDCEDELFFNVTLPPGWQVIPSFEPRVSALVDELNRERARIFYKGSAHDRKAFLHLTCRYNVRDWDPAEILEDRGLHEFVREVADGGSALQATGEAIFLCSAEVPADGHGSDMLAKKVRYHAHRCAVKEAVAWLDENYPDHQNPFAHWD